MRSKIFFFLVLFIVGLSCSKKLVPSTSSSEDTGKVSAFWKNATVYFLLTDRFYNGDPGNDFPFDRKRDGAVLRNFEGGDLQGITKKIKEGYFSKLGVTALWLTPFVEQIKSHTDEGTGKTYGYHGYWARDWTSVDPNFGTEAGLKEMIATAHQNGIRILMDVVINHTGPVTPIDTQWPDDWVRTDPSCTYQDFETTVVCTLVDNLPDIRTESTSAVELPSFLKEKWAKENRLQKEELELDAFFKRTGHPRAPHFYIMKWVTDWVRKYGIDGFRVDTAKHTEPEIWEALKKESKLAFQEWKKRNPDTKLEDEDFYMVGEVYNYGFTGGQEYDYGDRKVNFFDYGFESLINFDFKTDANLKPEKLFAKYSSILNGGAMDGLSVLNYISSHDDGSPFDRERQQSMDAATKLMLTPGGVQIYYGDETARPLVVKGSNGDANLRSFMNWEDIERNTATQKLLAHWQKLGQFRAEHPAVGAGVHKQLQVAPYIFQRSLGQSDKVLAGLDMAKGKKTISVFGLFKNGTQVKDYYSGAIATVSKGQLSIDSDFEIVLLGLAGG